MRENPNGAESLRPRKSERGAAIAGYQALFLSKSQTLNGTLVPRTQHDTLTAQPIRQLYIHILHDLCVEVFRIFFLLCELHFFGEGYPGRLLAAHAAHPAEESTSASAPRPLLLPTLTTFTSKYLLWHHDLFGAIVRTLKGLAMAGTSRLREVHVEFRRRQNNFYLNMTLRLNLATLRKHCDVVVYKDADDI